MSSGSNRRIGSMCVGVQLLYSPVPVFFRSPLLAALEYPKLVGPLSDAPFLIVVSVGIGHVFNLGCCGGRCHFKLAVGPFGEPSLETIVDRISGTPKRMHHAARVSQ